jgi:hypothetical protein
MKMKMIKALATLASLTLFVATIHATDKAINAYKTHKVTSSTVMVSCNDEREPVIKKMDGPFVLVTCTETK